MSENVRKAVLIGIVVVLGIALAGVLFWRNSEAPSEPDNTENTSPNQQETENQPTNTVEVEPPEDISTQNWETYTDDTLNFSLQHPPDAEVSSPQNNIRRIRLLGSDNTEDTEISDGFTFTVTRNQNASQYSSLEEYGQDVIANVQQKPDLELLNDRGITPLGKNDTYIYVSRTALGNTKTTYLFLPENTNQGYKVSVSVQDPNQNGYSNITTTMLNTFTFTQTP